MRRSTKGLIQVYTGEGKGKTTASLGLACRAKGYSKNVAFMYFHKNPLKNCRGEYESLKKLDIDVFVASKYHPLMNGGTKKSNVREDCLKGLQMVKRMYLESRYDVLILDEMNICLRDGFLKIPEVLEIIEKKPKNLELILTGRGAPEEIKEKADLVSEIKKIKHPYDSGVKARKSIDY